MEGDSLLFREETSLQRCTDFEEVIGDRRGCHSRNLLGEFLEYFLDIRNHVEQNSPGFGVVKIHSKVVMFVPSCGLKWFVRGYISLL